MSIGDSLDTWTCLIEIRNVGFDVTFRLIDGHIAHHYALRIEGVVRVADSPSIEGTSAYVEFWAGDDSRVLEIHRSGRLGSLSIAKDAPVIKDFSYDPKRQLAGMEVAVPLLEDQMRETRDNLALASVESLTVGFECVGDALMKEETFDRPRPLYLGEKKVDLQIIAYKLNFHV